MNRIRVGVVRGGTNSLYDSSLKTGDSVLFNISREQYEPLDVVIAPDGNWVMQGFPVTAEKLSRQVDVVFNALHGPYGEDGKVQQLFEIYHMPYTGSRVMPSALAQNKGLAKHSFEHVGLKTPRSMVVKQGENIEERAYAVFKNLPMPYIVKPLSLGGSIGVGIVYSYEQLVLALRAILEANPAAIVEEYVRGKEITVGVIEGVGEGQLYALEPVEIRTADDDRAWSRVHKMRDSAELVIPATLSQDDRSRLRSLAIQAHQTLGLRHYSRADFVVTPSGVYLLEVNSLPQLHEEGPFASSLRASDISTPEFIDHLLTLALQR